MDKPWIETPVLYVFNLITGFSANKVGFPIEDFCEHGDIANHIKFKEICHSSKRYFASVGV